MNKKSQLEAERDEQVELQRVRMLFKAVEDIFAKKPSSSVVAEATKIAAGWKVKISGNKKDFVTLVSGCRDSGTRDLLFVLGAIIETLNLFYSRYERMLRNFPEDLRNLVGMSYYKDFQPIIQTIKVPAKRKYERKRHRRRPKGAKGDIEEQFCGTATTGADTTMAEVDLLSYLSKAFSSAEPPFVGEPTCLDEILGGGLVKMITLEALFGRERHEFPPGLEAVKKGRETFYDYRTAVKITDALLDNQWTKRRKRSVKGRGTRRSWPKLPENRAAVLAGIEARLKTVSAPAKVVEAFQKVLDKYRADSGENKNEKRPTMERAS